MYKKDLPQELLQQAIKRLERLDKPVVRISGPLTTGGYGYEKNLERFKTAEAILKQKGFTVFDTSSDDATLREAGVPWEVVMNEYHTPLLLSNHIDEVYFLSGWESSKGASLERQIVESDIGIKCKDFPETWFA